MRALRNGIFDTALPEEEIRQHISSVISELESCNGPGKIPGKPDSPPAPLGIQVWSMVSAINPNNGGCHTRSVPGTKSAGAWRHTREMEKEILAFTAGLFAPALDRFDGYMTSGGTEGNLAGMWLGRTFLNKGEIERTALIVPRNAHFSVFKAADLLGLGESAGAGKTPGGWEIFEVNLDARCAMDPDHFMTLMHNLSKAGFQRFMVVANVGSTTTGSVDPLFQISAVLEQYRERGARTWLHLDAAYGGIVVPFLPGNALTSGEWPRFDSLSLDWHKFGLVPYGLGSFLCREGALDLVSRKTHYTSIGRDETVLNSRSGALVAALWGTLKSIGVRGLEQRVKDSLSVTDYFRRRLKNFNEYLEVLPDSGLNIVSLATKESGDALNELASHFNAQGIYADKIRRSEHDTLLNVFAFYVMPHVGYANVDAFLVELEKLICRFSNVKAVMHELRV